MHNDDSVVRVLPRFRRSEEEGGEDLTPDPDRPLGTVLVRSGADVAAKLRPGDRTSLAPGIGLRHTGAAVEVEDHASVGLSIFEARFTRVSLRPPCVIEVAGGGEIELENMLDEEGAVVAPSLPGIVGQSRPMRELAFRVRRFAKVRLPVLIRGESGVGKDLVARALHVIARPDRPFVAINAATISRDLAESELFGVCRGAYTGAFKDRLGAFREANQGTLFIDEIGSLGLEVQAKLLRVVEEGFVRPLGSDERVAVDVRLVVATCEPLESMVETGRFRADLYERLAVCIATVPPLHHRPSDIPPIARALLHSMGLGVRISPGALRVLANRRYRGNVRELRNVLAQSAMRTTSRVIETEHVLQTLAERTQHRRPLTPHEAISLLDRCDGNISRAAREANLPRSTLRDLMARGRGRGAVHALGGEVSPEELVEDELRAHALETRLVG
ncbi:MAG: sigma 54-interacting transcriptional regulator [Polyangiaceae bacterium]